MIYKREKNGERDDEKKKQQKTAKDVHVVRESTQYASTYRAKNIELDSCLMFRVNDDDDDDDYGMRGTVKRENNSEGCENDEAFRWNSNLAARYYIVSNILHRLYVHYKCTVRQPKTQYTKHKIRARTSILNVRCSMHTPETGGEKRFLSKGIL